MYQYSCMNAISEVGLQKFTDQYTQTEVKEEADALLVRSAALHDMEFSDKLAAIARAGAGVNNIPLERCAEQGIVVFNTPGANANGVKEAVIAGLLMASRDLVDGINWVSWQKKKKRILPEVRSKARSWVSSAWEPLVFWWPIQLYIWEWMSMVMTHTYPWTLHGTFPERSHISQM